VNDQAFDPADAFGLFRSWLRHTAFLRSALGRVVAELSRRSQEHDLSKLSDDEFAGFCRINAAARINKFGSPEYAEGMRRERGVIDTHFSRNSHHPEGREQSFLDVIEMVCDWWAASKGYDDPRSWADTVELNLAQKGKHLTPERLWLAREVAAFLASSA
jgi:hypothetical protein